MEKDFRGTRLDKLLAEAEQQVTELTGIFVYSSPRSQSQSTSALVQVNTFCIALVSYQRHLLVGV
jgi:hypothetical protein